MLFTGRDPGKLKSEWYCLASPLPDIGTKTWSGDYPTGKVGLPGRIWSSYQGNKHMARSLLSILSLADYNILVFSAIYISRLLDFHIVK